MPNNILLKRNATVGAAPAALAAGELAINSAEAKLYTQNSSGIIVPIVKTENRVLDGGVIVPSVTYQSYQPMLNNSADHFSGDKWTFMDNNALNNTWSCTLNVQYLELNGVLLVANQVAVPDPLFGRLLASNEITLVLNSANPPTYGAYSPYSAVAPRSYIDFLNNLWDAAEWVSSTYAPMNWKVNNESMIVYTLPSTMSFYLRLKEVFNVGTGTYHTGATSGEYIYEIRTKNSGDAYSTAKKIEDTITGSEHIEWFPT